MTDEKNNKLATTPDATRPAPLARGLHQRLRNPTANPETSPLTRRDRIALMVDVSGSMVGRKIASLREAVAGFVDSCDTGTCALALEPFGDDYPSPSRVALTVVLPMIRMTVDMLNACGGTPMAEAMRYVINTYAITRGVIVSDGQPDSEAACYEVAHDWHEAQLPCDCVHIGESEAGEACLRKIAEMTGGVYIKFTNIQAFSKAFRYLTPAFYAQLTAGSLDNLLGGKRE
jgi:Mg-chelatase subunit ChlD